MDTDRDALLAELLDAAGALHGPARAELLDARCGDDLELREELRSLLVHADAAPSSFMSGRTESAGRGPESGVFDRYRLIRELGRGGQGTVHLAEDAVLDRRVALKILDARGPGSEDLIARFQREAKVASALRHPGICTVYEAGTAGGVPFIAMQYVEGETLAQRIARARGGAGGAAEAARPAADADRTPPDGAPDRTRDRTGRAALLRTVALVEKVARALHVAHEAGVVHRDIKPGNIMIGPGDEPVLLDFGLARQDGSDLPTLTREGEIFGTPAYMAPEQIGPRRAKVDRRADVWALGVTLHEALALARPFDAATREGLYHAILAGDPADPRKANPAISSDLAVVIGAALEKDRDRRYQSALAFAEDLRRVREKEPILARPAGPLLRLRRWAERRPAVAAALVVAFACLAAGLVATWKEKLRAEAAESLAVRRGNQAEERRQAAEAARQAMETALAAADAARKRAEESEARHRKTTEFLKRTLSFGNPDVSKRPDLPFRTLLELAGAEVGTRLEGQPLAEAEVRTVIGESWLALGEAVRARAELTRALEIKDAMGAAAADLYATLRPLTFAVWDAEPAARWSVARRGYELRETLAAEHDADLAAAFGRLLRCMFQPRSDDVGAAVSGIETAAGRHPPAGPLRHLAVEQLFDVGHFALVTDALAAADVVSEAALRQALENLDPADPFLSKVANLRGEGLLRSGRGAEAAARFEEALRLRAGMPPDHPDALRLRAHLAKARSDTGDLAKAREIFDDVIPALRRVLGGIRSETLWTLSWAIDLASRTGDAAAGADWTRELQAGLMQVASRPPLELIRAALGGEQPAMLAASETLLGFFADGGPRDDLVGVATRDLETLLDDLDRSLGQEVPEDSIAAGVVGRLLSSAADSWEGWTSPALHRQLATTAARILDHWPAGMPLDASEAHFEIAMGARRGGDKSTEEAELRKSLALYESTPEPIRWRHALVKAKLGVVLSETGRPGEAEPLLLTGLAGAVKELGDFSNNTLLIYGRVVSHFCRHGKPGSALPFLMPMLRAGRIPSQRESLAMIATASPAVGQALESLANASLNDDRDVEALAVLHDRRPAELPDGDERSVLYAMEILQAANRRRITTGSIGAWRPALEEARDILARRADLPDRRRHLADLLVALADAEAGDPGAAEDALAGLLARVDQIGIGEAQANVGSAVTSCEVRVALATVRSGRNRPDEAVAAVEPALEAALRRGGPVFPETIEALRGLTRALVAARRPERLSGHWAPLLQDLIASPKKATTHDRLTWAAVMEPGLPADVLASAVTLAQAVAAEVGNGKDTYELTLAGLLVRSGNLVEAIPRLQALADNHPAEVDITLSLLALAVARQDGIDAARVHLDRLRSLPRLSLPARQIMAEIGRQGVP